MNRSSSKDSQNVSVSSSNGRISSSGGGTSLMNGNGQIVYRRSPIPHHHQVTSAYQQPQSFDTLGSPSNSTSYNSEEISDNINSFQDDSINALSEKFEQLQRQIEVLTSTQSTQDERYKRSRQENDALLNKVHNLEDQLREIELTSEARAKEDEKRFREAMAKQMKVKSQECEQHLHANFLLQENLFQLKNELLKSEDLIRKLRGEKEALVSELSEKNSELVLLDEEIHKLKLMVKNLKDEENVKSNLISILNEELEVSHNSRSHRELTNDQFNTSSSHHSNVLENSPKHRSSSSRRSSVTSGFNDDFSSSGAAAMANSRALKDIDGLEMSLSKLREDNRKLKDANEELQAQLLNVHLEEGRSLVQEGNQSYSLADEMGDIDVHRLMKALKEEQEDNARLRKYVDKMLLKIVDKNPALLEINANNDKK